MHAGGTILNWAGRVPEIDEIETVSGRETVEVGQWDNTLDELRDDPEVEEAIVAIDSDPPPGPFVRSRPPSDRAIDEAVERGEAPQRDAAVDYHEPPDVDPPPLTYEQVFEKEAEASIRAPRAVRSSSIAPRRPAKPTMLPWALLVLAIGCAVAALAYLMSPAATRTGPVADTVAGTGTVTGPDTDHCTRPRHSLSRLRPRSLSRPRPPTPTRPRPALQTRPRPRTPSRPPPRILTRSSPKPAPSIRTRRSSLLLVD